MTTRIIAGLILLASATSAHADFIGVFAGIGGWRADFSGDVVSNVNVENELGIADDLSNYAYFAFEHPVPLLPNIRVERTNVSDTGTGTLTGSFEFAGEDFTVGEMVEADIDLTSTDLTLYYELLDTGMDLDVGLTARVFQGDVIIDNASRSVTGGLPMLYARAKFGLPFSGFYLGADINTLSYRDSELTDLSFTVGWEIENFILPEFGIEGGYRRMTLELDPDEFDVGVDVDLDGVFVNLTAHF